MEFLKELNLREGLLVSVMYDDNAVGIAKTEEGVMDMLSDCYPDETPRVVSFEWMKFIDQLKLVVEFTDKENGDTNEVDYYLQTVTVYS